MGRTIGQEGNGDEQEGDDTMIWLILSRIFMLGLGLALYRTEDMFLQVGGIFFIVGLVLDLIYQVRLTEKKDSLY